MHLEQCLHRQKNELKKRHFAFWRVYSRHWQAIKNQSSLGKKLPKHSQNICKVSPFKLFMSCSHFQSMACRRAAYKEVHCHHLVWAWNVRGLLSPKSNLAEWLQNFSLQAKTRRRLDLDNFQMWSAHKLAFGICLGEALKLSAGFLLRFAIRGPFGSTVGRKPSSTFKGSRRN